MRTMALLKVGLFGFILHGIYKFALPGPNSSTTAVVEACKNAPLARPYLSLNFALAERGKFRPESPRGRPNNKQKIVRLPTKKHLEIYASLNNAKPLV